MNSGNIQHPTSNSQHSMKGTKPEVRSQRSEGGACWLAATEVAQNCILPYRRIAFGMAPKIQEAATLAAPGGLQIRDTAD
jgi:hypothetical protein